MPKPSNTLFRRFHLLILALLALALSFGWSRLFYAGPDQASEGRRIFRVFEEKEKRLKGEMEWMAQLLSSGTKVKDLWKETERLEQEPHGLFYTVSANDTLVYWSSSLVAFDNKAEIVKAEGILKKMATGWFYLFTRQADRFTITGYMLIKRDFPYQNRYVQSTFQEDFKLSDQCEVATVQLPGNIQVFCQEGKFHFGIHYRNRGSLDSNEFILPFLFLLLFVVLLQSHFGRWISSLRLNSRIKFGLFTLFAAAFYLLLNFLKLPEVVYSAKLFTPIHFAWGSLLSSLGDYLLLSVFLFLLAQSFFSLFRKEHIVRGFHVGTLFFFGVATAYFVLSTSLVLLLLKNSDLSLELYKNFTLSVPNILATGCIALQMVGLGALLVRVRCVVQEGKKYVGFFVPGAVFLGFWWIIAFVSDLAFAPSISVAYLVVLLLFDLSSLELLLKYKRTTLLVFGLVMAFGLNLTAQREEEKRKTSIQQVMAVTLASERDPAAEIFLTEFKSKVTRDSVIQSYLLPPYRKLESYLRQQYFTGFWNNYLLQFTVCTATDSVYLPDERKQFPCMEFFQKLTLSNGVVLPGSDFYFMDKLNGRISYLGQLQLFDPQTRKPLVVYIELNSKIVPEGKGYPQLLLDQQAARRNREEGYSYAKYYDNKLVDRGGSYLYNTVILPEEHRSEEFTFYEKGGFSHCVYKRSEANFVVISYPLTSLVDKGRGFPALFLIIYLIGILWIQGNQRVKLLPRGRLELRGKIQLTLVSTLLVLLFLVGGGLVQYNYQEFQRSMKESLDQKVRAISLELGLRIGHASKLDSLHTYLGDQLSEISDITWSDINLYDLEGNLAASSRNEIFDRGLTSGRMNPQAFRAMSVQGNATFLHNENLGRMEFFSVYAPLINQKEELTGYVNLPYFNRQDEFTRQVTGFIVAFINLYILVVLLTMMIALAISTKLTVPLLQIEQKLKGIALGKQNARIEYQGADEIGRLVEAYNKKVAELADSAALLARSERESAWKEMARQVAHEINNPLTPMKLNVQYLQKVKEEGSPNFDDYFNRVTRMLVAQIDALSAIASAFSDFARMPSTHIESVEMVGLVREIATLFDAPEGYDLIVSYPELPKVFVSGDRDQLRRALVNIVRNATQAIQNRSRGTILVSVEVHGQLLRIAVSDNGNGIPEADRDRLFEPSFTTKSGGMGLGLAITKSIIENYKGEIGFQSDEGGTTFFIDFPLS
jgi:signal transduction histidine kinase